MAHTSYTPKLSESWNFTLDGNGDLKMLEGTPAILQNVSNEGRCFTNDLFYYADHGIDWLGEQLGEPVQKAVVAARLRDAALSVAGVKAVEAVELKTVDARERTLSGAITIKTTEGENGRSEI